jgi:hypothetical protein
VNDVNLQRGLHYGADYQHLFMKKMMAVALKLSDDLVEAAKTTASAEHRSVPKQIEYWHALARQFWRILKCHCDSSWTRCCPSKKQRLAN